MITIPEQLQKAGYEFVLLGVKSKLPIEMGWPDKIINYDDSRILLHNGNIGIKGGGINRLVIVDCDTQEIQDNLIKILPETFMVKSGGRGFYHLYFRCDGSDELKSFKIPGVVDIQANRKYVVAPNSEHENGNTWSVVNDKPIAQIGYAQLVAIIKSFNNVPEKVEVKKKEYVKKDGDSIKDEIISKVSLMDVINHYGYKLNEHNKMVCPFHKDTNASFQVDAEEQTGYCYGCDSSWNATKFIEEKEKCKFGKALEIMAKICGMEEDLKLDRIKYNVIVSAVVNPEESSILKPQTTIYRQLAVDYYKRQPYFFDEHKIWWLWNAERFCWEDKDETDVMIGFDKFFVQDTERSDFKSRELEAMRKFGRGMRPKDIKPSWVQFKNRIYDIATGLDFEATPFWFVANPIDWKVGETEDTPTIDKIFNQWVEPKDVQRLYELMAFIPVPKYFIHSFIFLYSPPGMGKGTFVEMINRFIGRHNSTATSINRINNNSRFEVYGWNKKLMITMSEVSNINDLKNSGLINQATGEDPLKVEIKGLAKTFDMINYGKFIYPTNKLLKVEAGDGFGRRVRVIEFKTRFQKEADILNTIPDAEYENLARKCLRIAKDLWISRRFTGDVDIQERMDVYQEMSKTSLERFLDTECDLSDFSAQISLDEMFGAYSKYLLKNKSLVLSKIKFSRDMKGLGYLASKVSVSQGITNGWKSEMVYTGIKLIENGDILLK
jgi:phage/plasmid-associated DNA primase